MQTPASGGGGLYGGTVANTTAVDSTVIASGNDTFAGIGGWLVNGTVTDTLAVNSTVNNRTITGMGSISNDQLSTLCQNADPRVLTAECNPRTAFLNVIGFSHSDVCPVNAATASTAAATAGITIGSLVAAGVVVACYSGYQWITGYREGLRGRELAMKPFPPVRALADAVANE